MSDTAGNALASAEPSEKEPQATMGPGREPVPRGVYVLMRLDEIGLAVSEMAREREELTAVLKDPSSNEGSNQKKLRQRRGYLAVRLAILRKEQAELNAEKKANGTTGGPRSGEKSKFASSLPRNP